ncbi:uncharacterized protein LOC111007440 [Momordica charantia]|uniref:Uncharacterized protein LOC111007440 n=1 Tax=Momordica charantia TaxID=3673 RepID=A0A6J1C1L3_MOMCH|nr:uncharacterized protein LOC111007440 [Momordica charantia]
MKELSFFLFKNSLAAKMRKGIRTFCNGDGSTSTLNQHKANQDHFPISPDVRCRKNPPTLEEMILQLELEEETARRAKLYNYDEMRGRMSCVNNSDILRSARNALNQYPRFSLDGKDAMYRSSFRNLDAAGRKSVCCEYALKGRIHENEFNLTLETALRLPSTIAGESVVWRKPGVVAKLMGLEAIPMPVNAKGGKAKLSSILKRHNLRRRAKRHEKERRFGMDYPGSDGTITGRLSSCSSNNGCYVVKPIATESAAWKARQFL